MSSLFSRSGSGVFSHPPGDRGDCEEQDVRGGWLRDGGGQGGWSGRQSRHGGRVQPNRPARDRETTRVVYVDENQEQKLLRNNKSGLCRRISTEKTWETTRVVYVDVDINKKDDWETTRVIYVDGYQQQKLLLIHSLGHLWNWSARDWETTRVVYVDENQQKGLLKMTRVVYVDVDRYVQKWSAKN